MPLYAVRNRGALGFAQEVLQTEGAEGIPADKEPLMAFPDTPEGWNELRRHFLSQAMNDLDNRRAYPYS